MIRIICTDQFNKQTNKTNQSEVLSGITRDYHNNEKLQRIKTPKSKYNIKIIHRIQNIIRKDFTHCQFS